MADWVTVPVEPPTEIIAKIAEAFDPTWGYPDASIGLKWAAEAYKIIVSEAAPIKPDDELARLERELEFALGILRDALTADQLQYIMSARAKVKESDE